MGELSDTGGGLSFELSLGSDGSPLVKLEGELDLATAEALEAALRPVIEQGPRRLVVDAGGLQFADSSAIALLVSVADVVDEVEVRDPPDLLRAVITRMGLDARLRLTP
jgi:anti-anti-sigma regulatory factor